ncbi:MAG TPA: hypothetical protein DCQ29_00640 [Chitinophagaceae bacterium]|nr:hypothetical protein [Chitinophagaceae bacterium]
MIISGSLTIWIQSANFIQQPLLIFMSSMLTPIPLALAQANQEDIHNSLIRFQRLHARRLLARLVSALPILLILNLLWMQQQWLIEVVLMSILAVVSIVAVKTANLKTVFISSFLVSLILVMVQSLQTAFLPVRALPIQITCTGLLLLGIAWSSSWRTRYTLVLTLLAWSLTYLSCFWWQGAASAQSLFESYYYGWLIILGILATAFSYSQRRKLLHDIHKNEIIEASNSMLSELQELLMDVKVRAASIQRHLDKVSETRNTTLQMLLHDLNGFNTSIQSGVDLLKDDHLTPQQQQVVALIEKANERFAFFAKKMAKANMDDQQRNSFHYAEFDINRIVSEAAANLKQVAMVHQVQLQLQLQPGILPVYLDEQVTYQLMYKLLSNVIRLSDVGSTVKIVSGVVGTDVVITCKTTGNLIGQAKLDEIFNRLQQAATGDRDLTEVKGLGLSIARQLTEKMGGHLHYESNDAHGNAFTVQFPGA